MRPGAGRWHWSGAFQARERQLTCTRVVTVLGLCHGGLSFPLTCMFCVQIDIAGDFGLRVYSASSRAHRIVPVDVAPVGAQFVITVGKPSTRPPPYRIVNRLGSSHCLYECVT